MKRFRNIPFKPQLNSYTIRVKIRRGYRVTHRIDGTRPVTPDIIRLPKDKSKIIYNIGTFDRLLYVKGEDY